MTAGELRERRRYRAEHQARQSERRALLGLALMGWAAFALTALRLLAAFY